MNISTVHNNQTNNKFRTSAHPSKVCYKVLLAEFTKPRVDTRSGPPKLRWFTTFITPMNL